MNLFSKGKQKQKKRKKEEKKEIRNVSYSKINACYFFI